MYFQNIKCKNSFKSYLPSQKLSLERSHSTISTNDHDLIKKCADEWNIDDHTLNTEKRLEVQYASVLIFTLGAFMH